MHLVCPPVLFGLTVSPLLLTGTSTNLASLALPLFLLRLLLTCLVLPLSQPLLLLLTYLPLPLFQPLLLLLTYLPLPLFQLLLLLTYLPLPLLLLFLLLTCLALPYFKKRNLKTTV